MQQELSLLCQRKKFCCALLAHDENEFYTLTVYNEPTYLLSSRGGRVWGLNLGSVAREVLDFVIITLCPWSLWCGMPPNGGVCWCGFFLDLIDFHSE